MNLVHDGIVEQDDVVAIRNLVAVVVAVTTVGDAEQQGNGWSAGSGS